MVFKNNFLTILFPVDRFSEMGPSSRTYFSNNGFTCLQILDYIYAFYQVAYCVNGTCSNIALVLKAINLYPGSLCCCSSFVGEHVSP